MIIELLITSCSFYCSRMTDYPKNHCFSNHSLALTVQEFDNIYDKEIAKRYDNI